MANTRWITILADPDEEELLLALRKRKSYVQPAFPHKLPKDPEYWSRGNLHDGLSDVRGFLQTPRGEEWLRRRMEEAADELDGDYDIPETLDDVAYVGT